MTAGGSPYRSSPSGRPRARQLTFHHFRITLVVAAALTTLAVAAGCTTSPRRIRVHCEPEAGPELHCDSSVRSFWGTWGRRRERVPSAPQLVPWSLGDRPLGFQSVGVKLDYESGRYKSNSRVVARFAQGPRVALTDWHPTRSGVSALEDLFAFERTLRDGKPATLDYRSGWGGLLSSIPLSVVALLLLWVYTGRTRIVFHPDTRTVEAATHSRWLTRATRRTFARGEIAEAIAASAPGSKGGTFYSPALRLKSGEIFLFGNLGATAPVRAEFIAKQLNRLLETEDGG